MTFPKRLEFLKGINNGTLELYPDEILMRVFGNLELRTQAGTLDERVFKSDQPCKALIFLAKNRHRRASIDEIANAVWGDRCLDRPYDSVKNVIYRLRKLLYPICEHPLIVSSGGSFMFAPNIKITLDTEVFEKQHKCLYNQEFSQQNSIELYEAILELYRGNLLVNFNDEQWIVNRRTYYLTLYIDVVKQYLNLLEKSESYLEMINAISKALEYEPFEPDLQWRLISVLMAQRRYPLAHQHFLATQHCLTAEQRSEFEDCWTKLMLH